MDTLTFLKTRLDANYFTRYAGWLSWTLELLRKRAAFDDAQSAWLAQQTEVLEAHLRSQRDQLPQPELIEAACFVPGHYRNIQPPLDVLLPERGGFTEPRLREATAWIDNVETYIGGFQTLPLERRSNLAQYIQSPLPQTDTLLQINEFLVSVANARPFSETENKLYKRLDASQASALGVYALELWDTGFEHNVDIAKDIFNQLACLPENSLIPLQTALLERRIYYPNGLRDIFYRGSQRELSASIIAKLTDDTDTDEVQQLIGVFVWGETELVEQQLNVWKTQPPEWWKTRYADSYPQIAGWELLLDGTRRQLFYPTCYALVNDPTQSQPPHLVQVFTSGQGECAWCQKQLANLFEFDLNDSRLDFLGLAGTKLIIASCLNCVGYATICVDIDLDGASTWSSHNVEPRYRADSDWGDLSNALTLADTPRGTYEAVSYDSHGQSQIGGFPAWVQDSDYPVCPNCQRQMMFIAQLQLSDIVSADGTFYAFLCPECSLAATTYQQT